jgi:predicted RNase H-like HicB family nuclease
MQLDFTIELWKKGKWYVARSPELDFVSQGETREEARKNLEEVIRIQFEEMTEMGTLEDYLKECGFEIQDDFIVPKNEIIGFEKASVHIG